MILSQLFVALRARLKVILLVFLSTLTAATIASFVIPKQYLATASLVVEFPSRDAMGGSVYLPGTVSGFLATQVEIIKSMSVVDKVISRLALDKDPETVTAWRAETAESTDIRSWIAERLNRQLGVVAAREGAYINLEYESKDPVMAARIVNAYADAYVESVLELRTRPSRQYAAMFENQVRERRAQLESAQKRLSKFQQENGIVATDERSDIESLRLQELSTQLVQLQAAASESSSLNRAARRSGGDVSDVVSNPLVQSLRTEVSRAEARYRDLATRLGSSHPQLVATQAELAELRSRLQTEVNRVARSLESSDAINHQRMADVSAALDRQREKVLSLKRQRDEMALLQQEVDTAQKTLEVLMQRATQTSIEGASSTSNVSIVSSAAVPSEPSRPKPRLNILLGAFFGLVLGALAAVALESTQRPLRSPDDLLAAVGIPVLAVLPPAGTIREHRLIGDASVAQLRLER